MSKYTPETALAIKRDIQKSQKMLGILLAEIEQKKEEKSLIDKEIAVQNEFLAGKRGFIAKFEDLVTGVYTQGLAKIKSNEEKVVSLGKTISQLETARDLLNTEISLRQEEVKEPAGAILVQSLIAQLEPVLDRLLFEIDASEKTLADLSKKKEEFIKANEALSQEASEQEQRVLAARASVEEANELRAKALKELARENQKLTLIRERERDSSAMNRRLTDEYIKVYESTPRRGKAK